MAEHSIKAGHHIHFIGTSILDRTSEYMDCLIKEATEIRQNANNFNRDGGFMLKRACDMVTDMLTRNMAKQSQHLTLPASTQRLATNHEQGIGAGM
jgi:hypothetical protein